MNLSRLGAVMWKEFRQLRRDPMSVGVLIGIPVLQLLMFGYAIQMDVRNLPTAVYDESGTQQSRALIRAFQSTGNFQVERAVSSREEIHDLIKRGVVRAGVIIPPEYARDLKRGRSPQIQVLIDAADPLASQSAINTATLIGQAVARPAMGLRDPQRVVRPRPPPSATPSSAATNYVPIDVRVRPLFNPGLRSAVYIVPGIIGVILTLTMMMITAVAIVRERERGTLEQLIVTPLLSSELMLGKVVPYVLIGYFQTSAVLLLGRFVFDVPVRGNLLLFYAITFAFILASLGIGLLISTVADSQRQAMMLGYFLILPTILLSGFMFPREAMPMVAQWIGLILPLTYYLDVLRGIILRGAGMDALWRETLVLGGFALALIAISARRFRKQLD